MSKVITVFGATGGQGNGVALALAKRSGYKVRGVTRNPDSESAKKLKEQGCDLVQVMNMDDVASLERAIAGSYGVFAVTNFGRMLAEDPKTAAEREIKQGKAIGDICKKLGVKHLVFSGLELVKEIIGKPCPHFDAKGTVEKYLDEINVPNTSTRVAFYYDNFYTFFPPQKKDDGTYSVTLPMDGPMDGIQVSDVGEAVASIFDNPGEYIGKKVGLAGDKLTVDEYVAIMSKVTGKTITYNQVPVEVYAKFPFTGAEDLAVMIEYLSVGNPVRDLELTRKLNPATVKFQEWAEKNKDKFIK